MAYASLDDINAHLPTDKIRATEAKVELVELDAERIIRGQVGGVVEQAKILSWASPEITPELIRAIAGRLIASAIYAKAVSENTDLVPQYAQQKYNEAMALLLGIKTGTEILIDVDGTTLILAQTSLSEDNFFPIDATGRMFTVGQRFF